MTRFACFNPWKYLRRRWRRQRWWCCLPACQPKTHPGYYTSHMLCLKPLPCGAALTGAAAAAPAAGGGSRYLAVCAKICKSQNLSFEQTVARFCSRWLSAFEPSGLSELRQSLDILPHSYTYVWEHYICSLSLCVCVCLCSAWLCKIPCTCSKQRFFQCPTSCTCLTAIQNQNQKYKKQQANKKYSEISSTLLNEYIILLQL